MQLLSKEKKILQPSLQTFGNYATDFWSINLAAAGSFQRLRDSQPSQKSK